MIGLIAVSTITYMIIWMRRHAREIKATLEGEAASALAAGSTMALVGMAFLAVLREGFETSVFLLAAFQDATDTTAAGAGAVLGLVAAVAIGLGLYRGGVRINLTRFFRVTGAGPRLRRRRPARHRAHTAHEAGWINGLQGQALDLTWLVQPGTISRLAADRDAGPAARADGDRGRGLRPLRGADGALRHLAGPLPPGPAEPGRGAPGRAGREPGVRPRPAWR